LRPPWPGSLPAARSWPPACSPPWPSRAGSSFRDRRPGRTIASTGPDLVPVERATVTVGGPAAADVARLDEVLRRIAATDTQTLHVAAVQLTSGDITLHLAAAAELADPWRSGDAAGLIWTFAAAAEARSAGPDPDEVGAIAPYPTLVSIGSDATSSWLLDLEQAGGLVLTGDSDRCLDLARVMAGQLGLNPWADAVSVTMLGFGRELLDAAPGRLRYAPPGDADAVLSATIAEAVRTADFADENHVGVVEGRRRAVADETWAPQVLLVGGETLGADDILGADKAAAAPTIAGLLELARRPPRRHRDRRRVRRRRPARLSGCWWHARPSQRGRNPDSAERRAERRGRRLG